MHAMLTFGVLLATLGVDDPHHTEFVDVTVKGKLTVSGDSHFVVSKKIKFKLILTPSQAETAKRLKGKRVLVQAELQQTVKDGKPLLELKVRGIQRAIHDIELIADENGKFKQARINGAVVVATESKLAHLVKHTTMREIRIRFDKKLSKETVDRILLSIHKNAVYIGGVKRISFGPREP